ncbi:alginate lyase family protein [Paenibacillus sp. GCM10027629]|uniref:alginate lyase family protein n=1 Tax=Paenibacillus sp. GCM10027629 TaxID=3273414 RepID=UPI0036254E5B
MSSQVEMLNTVYSAKLECILKRTHATGTAAIDRAESIYSNNIYLHQSLVEHTVKSINEVWELQGEPRNTYQVYLHSFQFLSYLNNGYEVTKNIKYLTRIKEVILGWLNYNNKENSQFIWYDFSVANRTIVITHFLYLCEQAQFELDDAFKILLFNSLLQHGDFLCEENNYIDNNHGLMMDRALLQLSLFFKNTYKFDEWYNKSLYRINQQLQDSFTNDYINVENSPEYHYHTYLLFEELSNFLVLNKIEVTDKKFQSTLDKVFNNHLEMLNQNQSYPLIGDTTEKTFPGNGFKGNSIVFPDSGLAILKTNNSYLTIKSGYINTSHKHYDDISFTFSYKGVNLFIDSGKYNYNNKDPLRQYIISAYAHNGIVVDGENYSINKENANKAKITSYVISEHVDKIELINNLYQGVEITRNLLFIKPNVLIIFDEMISNENHNYSLIFNVDTNAEMRFIEKGMFGFCVNDSGTSVVLDQSLIPDNVIYSYGKKDDRSIRGFRSIKFGELNPCHNVEFIYKDRKSCECITHITVSNNSEEDESELKACEIIEVNKKTVVLFIKVNKQSIIYSITKTDVSEVMKLEGTDINREGDVIRLEIKGVGNDLEYACYILINNKIMEKFKYQDSPIFNYEITSKGSLTMWTFVRSKKNNTYKIIDKENPSINI